MNRLPVPLLSRSVFWVTGLLVALQVAVLAHPFAAYGQPSALELTHQSRFWIEGSSSVNRFTCHVDVVEGGGSLPESPASSTAAETVPGDSVKLTIPVQRFDCGKDRMTEDLKETLQADEHPTIRFRLHSASVLAPPDTAGGWYRIEALGHLTIAGTTRLIRTDAYGRALHDGLYELRGCKPLHMTYFGIEPPTKFLGVVKVHDRIVVHFGLVAQPPDQPDPSVSALTFTKPASCHD